ncbi:MAG: ferric reductase-like transmembrane domain-containing protein [Lapillicoccus sp.]
MTSPALWYLNRGTGLVLLVLYTVVVVAGIAATRRNPGPRIWPRFAGQALHRSLGLLAATLLAVHVTTAVADEFVDIRWWQALVPFGATYRPLYLELGTVTLDLTVAVIVTALLRHRLPERFWRATHLLAYPAWAAAVVHTLGIGTDAGEHWVRIGLYACVAAVLLASTVRLVPRPLRVGVR